MRSVVLIAALAALWPGLAFAQDKCSQLQILNRVQMIRTAGSDLVPVSLNGVTKNFVFDTGGSLTQVGRGVVEELKLPVRQGNIQLYDVVGRVSRDEVSVKQFQIGNMRGVDRTLPVSPIAGIDGLFALDHWTSMDLDVDFSTDTLSIFSQDHCPGRVQYWSAPVLAAIPIRLEQFHIIVPITIDGRQERAVVDTGAPHTTMTIETAQRLFDLTMGGDDTPQQSTLSGDCTLKTYTHRFKSLSFGDIAVNNPQIVIIPEVMGRSADRAQLVGDRTKSDKDLLEKPDMLIGMDVLRKLHIYIAFGESKMYITDATPPAAGAAPEPAAPASATAAAPAPGACPGTLTPEQRAANRTNMAAAPRAAVQAAFRKYATDQIAKMDQMLATDPNNISALNNRCFMRAAVKSDLEAALADCNKGIGLKPGEPHTLDSRAFVLYQQGKYPDAVTAYDAALAAAPKRAASLFMRGYAKNKLGDKADGDADIAAAKAIQSDIDLDFKPFDMDL